MVYYLSIEYLLGRSLQNAINNVELENNYTVALKEVSESRLSLKYDELDSWFRSGFCSRTSTAKRVTRHWEMAALVV